MSLKRLWLQLAVVSLVVSTGAIQYHRQLQQQDNKQEIALTRLDLLYLNEPASGAASLGLVAGKKAVVIFCQTCDLPKVTGAQVIRSTDRMLAGSYGLTTSNRQLGPGYAIIDSHQAVRYRSFDSNPAHHDAEIGRLVKGIK